jgi:hypothetical protein
VKQSRSNQQSIKNEDSRYTQNSKEYTNCPFCGYTHLLDKKIVCYRLRHPNEDVDGFPNGWNSDGDFEDTIGG